MGFSWRKFFSYYRPYKKRLLLVLSCALIVAAASLCVPLVIRTITQKAASPDKLLSSVGPYAALLIGLIAVHAVCSYIYDYHGHAMGAMMERDMRAELFAHYEKLSFSFHTDHKPGELLSHLTNDLYNLAELYHHGPENLLINGITLVGGAAVLLAINTRLALATLAFLPAIALFSLVVGARMNKAVAHNLDRIAQVDSFVEENLSGIRVVKSFANEQFEVTRFGRENNLYLKSRCGIYKAQAQHTVGIFVLTQMITVAVIAVFGVSSRTAPIDLSDLITFFLYINYMVSPMRSLSFMMEQLQEGIAGFRIFSEFMAQSPSPQNAPDARPLKDAQGAIEFDDVSFRYQPHLPDVLSHITLTLKAGERVALVGPSGVGKTTLCALIPRFYDVCGGQLRIDGRDVRSYTLDSLRHAVGIVQQDVHLFSGSVMENIRFGNPSASDEAVVEAAKRAHAHDFILALPNGYQTDIGRRGVKLSGGEQQRLSIARVFLKNPRIVIFDEATSALDNESESKVQEAIEQLTQGRTTIVIAHRLSTICGADRILVLMDGRIAQEGTNAELLAQNGLYARLYSAGQRQTG